MYNIIKNKQVIKRFDSWNLAVDWMQRREDQQELQMILCA
jgi:hypothetical protein